MVRRGCALLSGQRTAPTDRPLGFVRTTFVVQARALGWLPHDSPASILVSTIRAPAAEEAKAADLRGGAPLAPGAGTSGGGAVTTDAERSASVREVVAALRRRFFSGGQRSTFCAELAPLNEAGR